MSVGTPVGRAATVAILSLSTAAAAEWKQPSIPATKPSPRWERILSNQVRFLLATVPKGPVTGESVRQLSATAAGGAACIRFGACENSADVRGRVTEILRRVTSEREPWRRQWMSAFYAWSAAFGGWLMWNDLPADVRASLDAMVVDEADRFLDLPPPYAVAIDTKGEENAWNSLILVFASEVRPDHPHAARWRERSIEYMVSAFATPKDRLSDTPVDGRPLRQWLHGANVRDDFTIENHGFIHPDYYMIGPAMSLPSAVVYRLAGTNAPKALSHNVPEVYKSFKYFCLPGGDLLYPNGTDRTPHRLDMTTTLHVLMERLFQDRDAGVLAEDALVTLEKMQARNADGRTYVPGEFDNHKPAEGHAAILYSLALIATKFWDAPKQNRSLDQVWRDLEGAQLYEEGRFFVMRTPQSVSSFAWGLRTMALTMPFRRERPISPMPLSYAGRVAGKPDAEPKVLTALAGKESGAVFATLNTSHGGVPHSFSFVSLPGGKTVYMERWSGAAAIAGAASGMLSLLEEPRWIYGAPKRAILHDEATWLNVDGRLGFAISGGGGIRIDGPLLFLNAHPQRDAIIVTLPDSSAPATKEFAASAFRLTTDHRDVVVALVDGFIVAANLGAHPAAATVDYEGRKIPLPINGYSARVVRP